MHLICVQRSEDISIKVVATEGADLAVHGVSTIVVLLAMPAQLLISCGIAKVANIIRGAGNVEDSSKVHNVCVPGGRRHFVSSLLNLTGSVYAHVRLKSSVTVDGRISRVNGIQK